MKYGMNILSEAMVNQKGFSKLDEQFEQILKIENGVCKGDVGTHFKAIDKILFNKFNIGSKTAMLRGMNEHYGALVYPSYEEMNNIAIKILDSNGTDPKFNEITDVKIFFDEKLIKGTYGSMTGRELTAILLHEVGHKIFVNETRMSLVKMVIAMRLATLFNLIANVVRAAGAKSDLHVIRIMIECLVFSVFSTSVIAKMNNDKIEKMADSFAAKCGYAPELASALTKIFGSVKGVGTKINEEQNTKNLIKWMFVTLSHFNIRKNSILKVLEHELQNSKTPYEKEMIEKQITELKMILKIS